jgi:hypothetical protein
MEKIISTVFFDGCFWTALIERLEPDGTVFMGKYVFGPEPNNNELLHFYLHTAHTVKMLRSNIPVRARAAKSRGEQERITRKSFAEFKALQEEQLKARRSDTKARRRAEAEELFSRKREKRKKKKRGH